MEDLATLAVCVLLAVLALATFLAVGLLALDNARRLLLARRAEYVYGAFILEALTPVLIPYGIEIDFKKKRAVFRSPRNHVLHGNLGSQIEDTVRQLCQFDWDENQVYLVARLVGDLVKSCVAEVEEKIHSGKEMDIIFDDEGGIRVVPKT